MSEVGGRGREMSCDDSCVCVCRLKDVVMGEEGELKLREETVKNGWQ